MLHSQHAINVSFAYADYLSNIWPTATIFDRTWGIFHKHIIDHSRSYRN